MFCSIFSSNFLVFVFSLRVSCLVLASSSLSLRFFSLSLQPGLLSFFNSLLGIVYIHGTVPNFSLLSFVVFLYNQF